MTVETSFETRDPRDLKPHPDNPRELIDEGSQEFINFCADVKAKGVLQPIVIDVHDRIFIGHRRTRAAIIVGLPEVPVLVRPLQQGEFEEDIFLAENMQRQDLTPLEEARAFVRLRAKMEKEQGGKVPLADLCRRVSLPKNTVSLRLQILELPERVQLLFHQLEIPVNSSRELAKLKDWPDECEAMADRLVARVLTLKSLPTIVDRKLADLNEKDRKESAPARPIRTQLNHVSTQSTTPSVSRSSVVDSLGRSRGRSISMFNVGLVLEQTCCNCGLMGESVCGSCPLPKFVNGLIGRSDGGFDA